MDIGHTIRSVTTGMPSLVTGGVPGERAGDDRLAWAKYNAPDQLVISSPAFAEGHPIPSTFSAEGGNVSPPLRWIGLPEETRSLVLLVEDPDAPTPEPFVHWIVYLSALAGQQGSLPEGFSSEAAHEGVIEGANSTLKRGWTGCAPPKGDTAHRYHFQFFALNAAPEMEEKIGRTELFKKMEGHVVAKGRLVGTYQR